jgi:AGZA family xanthine/uracil permease-like MFS transporter
MKRPVLWTAGDWNAFFGFGTNILVNMLVLTGVPSGSGAYS